MVKRPPLFSDVSQVISGAASAFGEARGEIGLIAQSQIERALAKGGFVSREDFDAANARIDKLQARIEALEVQLKAAQTAQKPKKKAASTKKQTK